MTPPLSRLVEHGPYHHIALRNAAGGIEHWMLTANEVERIRERSIKNAHLAIPIVAEEPKGLLARWLHWVRG